MIAPPQDGPTAADDSMQGAATQNEVSASSSDGIISKPNNETVFVFPKKEELERGTMAEDMVHLYATTRNSSCDSSINQKRLKCRYKKLYEFISSGSADLIEGARRIDRVLNSVKDSKGKAISKWTALDYLPRECTPDNLKDDHLLKNHVIQSLHKRTEKRTEVRKNTRKHPLCSE